jgi:hypothetical protein
LKGTEGVQVIEKMGDANGLELLNLYRAAVAPRCS